MKGAEEVTDKTAVDLRLDETVEQEAIILPLTNPSWLDGDAMHIPAGANNVSHAFDVEVNAFWDEPFLIHSASLHMHRLGTRGILWIEREDGSLDCMLDIPRWDFGWQLSYLFEEPKLITPNDKLGIECHYDNSPANQPVEDGEQAEPRDVAWGDGTGDEMCLGIFYVSQP